ncbi:bactofilin family protein [Vibrio mangrovi]|uniref:Polymer-forming cytoskeletal n=1 Tax=Vibrio mangrovi TaxID=474394 RepID=A0A1Y6IP79_9VIBR|nr:polymer-forming cytoskeletal protein [Vibrio mangrovi]MDW6003737.1 polymer-forming cytoskeletal protein [Vibrio mangrovi]SMR99469.1 Polymer-forming cytoskeletal [Vibrio mangrovi]
MQVDGRIEGHIHTDKTLIISESGSASGEIYADHLIINGTFEGTCYASRIEILSKGQVDGTLYTEDLSIEQGGRFNGVAQPAPEQQIVDFQEAKTADSLASSQKTEPQAKKAPQGQKS